MGYESEVSMGYVPLSESGLDYPEVVTRNWLPLAGKLRVLDEEGRQIGLLSEINTRTLEYVQLIPVAGPEGHTFREVRGVAAQIQVGVVR